MDNFKPLLTKVLAKLSEKSSVLGILTLLTVSVGATVAPDRMDAIATATAAIASIGLVVVKEVP